MEIRREQDYIVNRWSGGITRELFIWPKGSSLAKRDFAIRISSAVIDSTGSDFSDFSGFVRYIMPLQGTIDLYRQGEKMRLEPGKLFRFSGSDKVSSTNTPGAIDFNVIVKEGVEVDVCVTGDFRSSVPGVKTIVFALGDAVINGTPLHPHATAITLAPVALQGQAVVITLNPGS